MSVNEAMDMLRERIDGLLPQGSLRRRLVRGTFWSLTGTMLSQGLALAASIVFGRVLGTEGFGEIGMIRSTVGMFGALAGATLGLTASKHVAEYRRADPAKAGRVIGLASGMAGLANGTMCVGLFFAASWLAPTVLAAHKLAHPEMLVTLLQIGCVMLFFDGMNGAQTGALAGFEAFKTIARVNLIQGLLNFPLMLVGVLVWGLRGVVCAFALASVIGWTLNYFALRGEARRAGIRVSYRGLRAELPILWRFWLPAYLSGLVYSPVFWAANAILVNTPNGYAALGLFNAANQWQIPVTFLAYQFAAVLLPMLASFHLDEGGEGRSERTLGVTYGVLVLIVLPAVAVLNALARPIMVLYGPQFAGAVPAFSAILFVGGCKAMSTMTDAALISRGAMWQILGINLAWSAVLLVMVRRWAGDGAGPFADAFAVAFATSGVLSYTVIALRRICPVGLVLRACVALLLLGVIVYAPVLFESGWVRPLVIPFAVVAALVCALSSGPFRSVLIRR